MLRKFDAGDYMLMSVVLIPVTLFMLSLVVR
jgi:hypothetical protein